MNYNHLFYFWNIAKEGSIKAASTKLHLSQPTLSDQLKTFEDAIGEKLFDRRSRKLILNERGKLVFKYTNKIFQIGNELVEALQNKENKDNRNVNIGFVPTIAKGKIYQILLPFLDHAELKIKVIEGEFDFINKAFEMGDLDIIICEKPIFHSEKSFVFKKFVASTFYIVCSPKFQDAKKKFPKSLSDIPFMNYTSRSDLQHQIFQYFHEHSIHPQIIGEVDDVNIIRRFTQNSHCFSILPKSVIAEPVDEGKLIVLSELEDIKITVHAVFRDSPDNKIIKEKMETIN
jgi:LysR family transcriptional regulator, transcriptional activator of nhaA